MRMLVGVTSRWWTGVEVRRSTKRISQWLDTSWVDEIWVGSVAFMDLENPERLLEGF